MQIEEDIRAVFGRKESTQLSLEVDKMIANKILSESKKMSNGKAIIEISYICDGTFLFLIDLVYKLKKVGCVNIKTREENVENPNPAWASKVFIATGVMWDTNNWRRMHGLSQKKKTLKSYLNREGK